MALCYNIERLKDWLLSWLTRITTVLNEMSFQFNSKLWTFKYSIHLICLLSSKSSNLLLLFSIFFPSQECRYVDSFFHIKFCNSLHFFYRCLFFKVFMIELNSIAVCKTNFIWLQFSAFILKFFLNKHSSFNLPFDCYSCTLLNTILSSPF